ncbi:MAG: flagellar basal-body rod modification protein FlgD [Clostridia bacterium]|nr:flagellar basal-body rod modification protein FlgD [Clostridia bacterium]
MTVSAVEGNTGSTWSQKTYNNLSKEAFLQLLAVQLRHQDPLQPLEDREFIAQLAQISTLEQIANLNESISFFLQTQQEIFFTQALGFVGLEIKAEVDGVPVSGVVTGVKLTEGKPYLLVGEEAVPIQALTEVRQPPAGEATPSGGAGSSAYAVPAGGGSS